MAIRLQGTVSRVLAAVLAIAMVSAPQPVSAAGPSEIERLYVEGQERYGSGDFAGAADSWTRLLENLPEAQANKATRENVLLNAVQACIDAYNRSRKEDGTKDIAHLTKGKAVLDKYYADYNRAYGDRAGVSQAVEEKTNDLDTELKKAEDEAAAAAGAGTEPDPTTDPTKTDPTTDTPPTNKVIVLEPQNAGNGLIVGGSVVGALGIGALVMGIIGAVRAPKAEDAYKQAVADGDEIAREKADFDGKQANKLTIAGFVLAPLLLGGGAAMLVIGIQRKQKAARSGNVAITPAFGRGFSGVSLSGRF